MTLVVQHIVPSPVSAPRVNNVVFISYLDEAGLSKHETHLVVAGIIVEDHELLNGETALERVLEKHIPEADREGFEFHAHALFTGSDYFSNKSKWPLAKRKVVIKDVVDILKKLKLPIISGAIHKANLRAKYHTPFDEHGLAFMLFAERVNKWVAGCKPDDCCLLIADETKKKRVIKSSLRQYRKQKIPIGNPDKLTHITDTIYFADSCDSWGLQLADFCNYFIKRHLIGGNELAEKVYQYFKDRIHESTVFP
jgi:hypothetical protein